MLELLERPSTEVAPRLLGAHLMVVLPSVNLTRAVHSAVAAWPYAAHLEPEDAAEILLRRMALAAATRLR